MADETEPGADPADKRVRPPRGQVQDSADGGDVPDDLDGDPDARGPGAVSATDQRAGSATGGSASGAEP